FETPALARWVGSLHLQAGASLAEKLDRQHMALGVQMCIQMCMCTWWSLWGAVGCRHGAWKDFNCLSLAARQGTHSGAMCQGHPCPTSLAAPISAALSASKLTG
uniref:Uncharacterized protein n=1 Tax=Athene cunicularia TaxID=194338 RepID=A0A663MKU7_ATHCN